jgi:carbamoyl-phosphate synthase large subunit
VENLNLFIRQSYTEAGEDELSIIQEIIRLVADMQLSSREISLLTGNRGYCKDTFKTAFEQYSGQIFTPHNFRAYRFKLLNQADKIIIIRTGLSESSAFEICYNIFKGCRAPIFFAIHEKFPIKTTLLQELDQLVPTTYYTFTDPVELQEPLLEFLETSNTCAPGVLSSASHEIAESC